MRLVVSLGSTRWPSYGKSASPFWSALQQLCSRHQIAIISLCLRQRCQCLSIDLTMVCLLELDISSKAMLQVDTASVAASAMSIEHAILAAGIMIALGAVGSGRLVAKAIEDIKRRFRRH